MSIWLSMGELMLGIIDLVMGLKFGTRCLVRPGFKYLASLGALLVLDRVK